MTKRITKEEFEAIAAANHIEIEKDVEYSYESVIDRDGKEIAFAVYNSNKPAEYHLREVE